MLKRFFVLIFVLFIFFSFVNVSFAKTSKTVAKPTPSPTPVPIVNSFELFWPLAAGKTMQSKVYFLKTLKEDVRGWLIFGSAQKADYDVFLAIKRMLEAEVLIKGNVADLANKTLDSATSDLDKANSALTSAKNSSDIDQGTKDEINNRVSNLKLFGSSLMNQYPDYKGKLQSVLDKLNSLAI